MPEARFARYRHASLKTPKGYTFAAGKNPRGPGACKFKIPSDLIDRYMRYGPAHKFFDLYAVQYVLRHPAAIFEGLEREQQQNGLCYAGIPPFIRRESQASMRPGSAEVQLVELPPPAGMTFVVFMNFKYVIFDWRWEQADAKNSGHPTGWETRFTKRLWPI